MYYWLKLLAVAFFSIFTGYNCFSQSAYRLKADITIKVKNIDSTFQFTKGRVFYDQNAKKIVYDISFPAKQLFVSHDTLLYRFVNDTLRSTTYSPLKPEFSVFHFILNEQLVDYGLKSSRFFISDVEKGKGLIVTTWSPPEGIDSPVGNIYISTKEKKLFAVLIHNSEGQLLSRQIYKKYIYVKGVNIPTEILSVSYIQGQKMYQIIQFENIVLNEEGNNNLYDYPIYKN
ncbi:MAG: hypothetical protein GXO81_00400 [Chlorobi bacterium]|nr:hypothetical protein [Chlorobiota bacterium]